MARRIQDQDMLFWEAYASSGEFGSPDRGKIVFHCLSDRNRRPRFVTREVERSEVEREVTRLSEAELRELLESSQPLS